MTTQQNKLAEEFEKAFGTSTLAFLDETSEQKLSCTPAHKKLLEWFEARLSEAGQEAYERGKREGKTVGMHEVVFCMSKLAEAHKSCGCLYSDAVRDAEKAMLSTDLPIYPQQND